MRTASLFFWFITWAFFGKLIFDRIYYRRISIEKELLEKNNSSLSFSFTGFLLSLSIALFEGTDPAYPVYINAISGTAILIFILLFTRLFDWIFLRKIDLPTEIIERRNRSAGIIEGGFFLSMGIIAAGALSGEYEKSIKWSLIDSAFYCALGIFLLFCVSILFSKILKIDLQQEVKRDNMAAGTAFSGVFIAISLVIASAISGPSKGSFVYDLKLTLFDFSFSFLIMIFLFYIFDLLLFRKFSLSEELKEPNLSAGIMIAGIALFSSILSLLILP